MKNIQYNIDDLLSMFPRNLSDLSVLCIQENEEKLELLYYQKNTDDVNRDWDLFKKWEIEYKKHIESKVKNIGKSRIEFPSTIDDLYKMYSHQIKSGKISKNDKLLLKVELRQDFLDDVVYLAMIQRNGGEDLVQLGKEFYENMTPWLKKQGFNYLSGFPANKKLESYWQKQGQVSYDDLDFEDRKHLCILYSPDLYIQKL